MPKWTPEIRAKWIEKQISKIWDDSILREIISRADIQISNAMMRRHTEAMIVNELATKSVWDMLIKGKVWNSKGPEQVPDSVILRSKGTPPAKFNMITRKPAVLRFGWDRKDLLQVRKPKKWARKK